MDELVALWHSQLSSETVVALVKGLKRIVHTHGVKLPIATVFSGTDVIVKILDSFSRYWKSVYAISVEFICPITCEDNPVKHHSLLSKCKVECMVPDAKNLASITVIDSVEGKTSIVPWLFGVVAGFPCTSRTPLNSNAKKNVGCVAAGTGATGTGFSALMDILDQHTPVWILFENNPPLLQQNADGKSDADHIDAAIKERGYLLKRIELEARDYGSYASRKRIYWTGWKMMSEQPGEQRTAHDFNHRIDTLLAEIKIDPLSIDHFVENDYEKRRPFMNSKNLLGVEDCSRPGKKLKDPAYKEEHHDIYRLLEEPWPPMSRRTVVGDEMLTDRMREVLHMVDKAWDCPEEATQFVDLMPRLGRLISWEPKKIAEQLAADPSLAENPKQLVKDHWRFKSL